MAFFLLFAMGPLIYMQHKRTWKALPFLIEQNLMSTEIKQKCSKLQLFSLESLQDSFYVWGIFSKGEGTNEKSQRCCCCSQCVWVYVAFFWHEIWTRCQWYFPLVTLCYCKIKCVYIKILTQLCVYSELSYGDAPPKIFHNGLLGESKRSLCLGYQSTLLCDFVKVCAIINY